MDLLEIREKLDVVDREIVRLFEERMRLCGQVAEFKIETGKPVFDAERESRSWRLPAPWPTGSSMNRR